MTVSGRSLERKGRITAFACGVDRPATTSLAVGTRAVTSNVVISAIGADGRVCLWTSRPTVLDVDVTGYFTDRQSYRSLPATRLLNTSARGRTVDGRLDGNGRLAVGSTTIVPVIGRGGVPATADSVVLTLISSSARTDGDLGVAACGNSRATVVSQHVAVGRPTVTTVVVAPDGAGSVCLTSTASAHVAIDVVGWFTGSAFGPPPRTACSTPDRSPGRRPPVRRRSGWGARRRPVGRRGGQRRVRHGRRVGRPLRHRQRLGGHPPPPDGGPSGGRHRARPARRGRPDGARLHRRRPPHLDIVGWFR